MGLVRELYRLALGIIDSGRILTKLAQEELIRFENDGALAFILLVGVAVLVLLFRRRHHGV